MLCTVVTDASYCPRTGAAGWAVWIVCDKGRHKQYGEFQKQPKDSHQAESWAILNGLHIARRKFPTSRYHVVTDSAYCIHTFEKEQKSRFSSPLLVSVTFAHVKAHTGKADARSFVNRWCDKHAKQAMQKIRNKRR